MKRKTKTRIITTTFTIFILSIFLGGYRLGVDKMPERINADTNEENITICTRVVDGDTIVISSGERIRLIGIGTPEVHSSNKLYRDAGRTGLSRNTWPYFYSSKAHEEN